jgi:phosphinothricin acetyltransferase
MKPTKKRKRESKVEESPQQDVIRPMRSSDATRVLDIYRMGIDTGNATFETRLPDWETWDNRHLLHSRFVYDDGIVQGWVALSSVSTREVYRGVAELSIYVDERARHRGIGSALMHQVIRSSEEHGIWTLFSSVFPENEATLKLHLNHGFRLIGQREKIAKLNGEWRDTLLLERRSCLEDSYFE